MSEMFIVILAILGVVLTGRSLLALIDRVCGTLELPRFPSEIWGISILLGVSFTAAAGFVWSDIGRPLNTSFAWKQLILGSILGLFATIQSFRRLQVTPVTSPGSSSPFLLRTFRLVLGTVIAAAFVVSIRSPQLLDALAQGPHKDRLEIERRANLLLASGSIDAPGLAPAGGYPYHFRDPLLLPLAERHVHALHGQASELAGAIWSPLCLAGLALSFAGVLSRRTGMAWGWIMATGLSVMPILWSPDLGIPARAADLPIASFHGVALLYLWDALQEVPGRIRVRALLLASGMASSAVFTKPEGLTYLAIDIVAWSVATLGSVRFGTSPGENLGRNPSWRRDLQGIAIFVVFAAALLTPWMIYRHAMPVNRSSVPSELVLPGKFMDRFSRPPAFLCDLMDQIVQDWWKGGLPFGLMLLALVSSPRRHWAIPPRFLLLSLLGFLTAAELFLAPAGFLPHLGGTSRPLLLQLTPLVLLCVAAGWKPTSDEVSSSVPERKL